MPWSPFGTRLVAEPSIVSDEFGSTVTSPELIFYVTFGAASSNAFLTPSEAGAADGDTTRYVIVDGTDYEEGIGTIASSVATMARTTVTKSKISGTAGTTKLDLSGTAVLALVVSAADILNPAKNLSDLASAPTALTNLGGTTVGKALFTATDAAAARGAIVGATRTITGADTIIASDIGKTLLFNSSSEITVALTAAATLGDGFWCRFKPVVAMLTFFLFVSRLLRHLAARDIVVRHLLESPSVEGLLRPFTSDAARWLVGCAKCATC
jgi:hypothetical protein